MTFKLLGCLPAGQLVLLTRCPVPGVNLSPDNRGKLKHALLSQAPLAGELLPAFQDSFVMVRTRLGRTWRRACSSHAGPWRTRAWPPAWRWTRSTTTWQ